MIGQLKYLVKLIVRQFWWRHIAMILEQLVKKATLGCRGYNSYNIIKNIHSGNFDKTEQFAWTIVKRSFVCGGSFQTTNIVEGNIFKIISFKF